MLPYSYFSPHHGSGKRRAYFTTRPPNRLDRLYHQPAHAILLCQRFAHKGGTGISTSYPSPTTVVLGLGPDLPWADEPSPGNLGLSTCRFLACISLLIPAFSLLHRPRLLSVPLLPVHYAPLLAGTRPARGGGARLQDIPGARGRSSPRSRPRRGLRASSRAPAGPASVARVRPRASEGITDLLSPRRPPARAGRPAAPAAGVSLVVAMEQTARATGWERPCTTARAIAKARPAVGPPRVRAW